MSETGDKVVSDKNMLNGYPFGCKCTGCNHANQFHHDVSGRCTIYGCTCRAFDAEPIVPENPNSDKHHIAAKEAFEAQHRPASQPQNADLPSDRCGGDGTYPSVPLAVEPQIEFFPEFWAGFGKRMEAAGDSPEVIAQTAWHAAKAGNALNRDEVLFAFHIAYEKPSAQNIIDWCTNYPQFAEDIRSHAAVAWDMAMEQQGDLPEIGEFTEKEKQDSSDWVRGANLLDFQNIYLELMVRERQLRASIKPEAPQPEFLDRLANMTRPEFCNITLQAKDDIRSLLNAYQFCRKPEAPEGAKEEYYIQDARSFTGNSVMWWCPEGQGYTSDLSKAWRVSKEFALKQMRSRATDRAWLCADIDAGAQSHFDMQNLRVMEPLAVREAGK